MLKFNIDGQTLRRIDIFNPATDSVAYLKAKFNVLSSDWAGVAKRAFFRLGEDSYDAVINNDGICEIPHEVLKRTDTGKLQGNVNKIYVSVVGERGSIRITTNEIRVDLNVSGYTNAKNSEEPTPSACSQFVAQVMDDNDATEAEIRALAERAEAANARVEEAETRIKSDYSNALKGRASGEVVRVDDVSPVEHTVKVKVIGKADASTVTVTRCGKNLFDTTKYKTRSATVNGVTVDILEDGCIYVHGTPIDTANATSISMQHYQAVDVFPKGTYVYNNNPIVNDENVYCFPQANRPTNKAWIININKTATYVPEAFCMDRFVVYVKEGTTKAVNAKFYLQVEGREEATEYEAYKGVEIYTPEADGTVNGVTSLSPTMTLLTDTEGVTLDVEYNVDINTAFAKILETLSKGAE